MADPTSERTTEAGAGWRSRRTVALLAGGALLALLIAVVGRSLVAWRLGDDAVVRDGLEREARRHVANVITDLQRLASTLANRPAVRAGLREAGQTPRPLFTTLDALVDPADD